MVVTLHKRVCDEFEEVLKEENVEYKREGTNFVVTATDIVCFKLGDSYRGIKDKVNEQIRKEASDSGAIRE